MDKEDYGRKNINNVDEEDKISLIVSSRELRNKLEQLLGEFRRSFMDEPYLGR